MLKKQGLSSTGKIEATGKFDPKKPVEKVANTEELRDRVSKQVDFKPVGSNANEK